MLGVRNSEGEVLVSEAAAYASNGSEGTRYRGVRCKESS